MKLPDGFTLADINELKSKVRQQKDIGTEHIREKREDKRDQMLKLLARNEKGKVKVHKVWKNLNLRKALFLRDEEEVKVVQESGPLGVKLAENANKVIKFDSVDMGGREEKEQVITDDGMFGLGCIMIDGYDDIEQQPIRTVVNPLLCYGDPRAWNTNKMEFFGTEVYKSMYELKESDYFFNIDKVTDEYSYAIQEWERARDDANETQHLTSDVINEYKKNNRVAIVNHITSYKGCLYLTSWTSSINTLIRIIKIKDLTHKERKRPDKVDLGVTLFRAKPIPYSFFGASLFDEVEQYQDLATLLVYLQVEQAKRNALGPNKFVDSRLGLDIDQIQNKPLSGGVIEYTPDLAAGDINANNGIIMEQKEPVSQYSHQMLQVNDSLMDETLGYSSQQVFGISQQGQQTKAEVQTLQQNINEQLGMIGDNYLASWKHVWYNHMMSYASNMPANKKKKVALFDGDVQDSYTFKKSDFVPNGKIQIFVTSKVQEDIRDKQDFAVISTIYNNVIPNIKSEAKANEFIRKYVDKGGAKGVTGKSVIPYNKDERKALNLLEVINNDEYERDVIGPDQGDDFDFIIEKISLAIDNESRKKAMTDYETAREQFEAVEPQQMQAPMQGNAQSASMTANMLASQQAEQIPSIGQVQ